jgi:arylsulfatase A-like enzyme
MRRRDFLKAMGLGAAALAVPQRPSVGEMSDKRPNILVLFTDDQRFDTINALNNPDVQTPNMDRLVRAGTSFTHAYTMGAMSGALCIPSRAMLMTGRTMFHLRNNGTIIPPDHVTLPELLQTHGYATFGTGKWHNDPASYARCFTNGGNIFFGGMSDHLEVPVHDFNPEGKYVRSEVRTANTFSSTLFSDTAIGFLREYKDDEPFMLYVSYTAPHDPRMAPKEYAEMYPPEKIELPKNFMPEHPFDNGDLRTRDEELAPWPRTPEVVKKHIADYYAMITHVDAQIGGVLDALEETGRAENTIIVFAGDNGLAVGQHGLLGKQNLYEHSVHVPLIIGGPSLPRGQTCDSFCYLLDVFRTLCDITGIAVPDSVEGKSLAPAIRDPKTKLRSTLLLAYRNVQRAARDERYKLIEYVVKGKRTTQLFDLQSDPWETKNLADDPDCAQHLQRLRKELLRWRDELDDRTAFWRGYGSGA